MGSRMAKPALDVGLVTSDAERLIRFYRKHCPAKADDVDHIIVKQGRITLLGVVDNESDKTVAGMRAREVPLSFSVDNELMIDRPAQSASSTR